MYQCDFCESTVSDREVQQEHCLLIAAAAINPAMQQSSTIGFYELCRVAPSRQSYFDDTRWGKPSPTRFLTIIFQLINTIRIRVRAAMIS